MFRQVEALTPSYGPLVTAVVEAMLGGGPIDPEMLRRLADPGLAEERARFDAELREKDWPNLGRYEAANALVLASGAAPDVVFMGDSITEAWPLADPDLFSAGRLCRGIAGQTSPQMLVRFHADVIALKPRAVHILAGTNDIAGNTGPTTPARYQANISAMLDLAQVHGVQVLLGSIPPAARFHWRPEIDPLPWIAELNAWLADQARARGGVYLGYHAVLAVEGGGMNPDFTADGVHPNRRGYAAMRAVLGDPVR